MAILDITSYAGPYPSGWGLLDDDAQTINDADTATLPQARITALKMYETAGAAGGGGGLNEVVDDTTPQLGGALDVNGNKIVSVSNGDIDLEPNGTGDVLLGNLTFDADQTVGAGQDDYVLTYDNAAGTIGLEASAGGGGGGELTYKELASITFSGESSVDVDVTGYDQVLVIWEDISFSTIGIFSTRVSADGVTFDSTGTAYSQMRTTSTENDTNDRGELRIGGRADASSTIYGTAGFSNLSSSGHRTTTFGTGGNLGGNNAVSKCNYKTARTDTHLRFLNYNGGTIDGGTLRVLGVGKSTSGTAELTYKELASFDFGAASSTSEDVDVTGYDVVELRWDGIGFDVADTLWARVSTNGTAFDSGASDYRRNLMDDGENTTNAGTAMQIDANVVGTANRHGTTQIRNLSSSTKSQYTSISGSHTAGDTVVRHGYRDTAQIDTHIRVFAALGNTINAGTLRVLGVGKNTLGLTPAASTPDANIQGVVGQIDVITTTSMTANRDYLLPATAAVGDRCGIHCVNDEPDHEILIKTPAASNDQIDGVDRDTNELTRLFIAGESMEFECIDAAGPHWRTMKDGRKPCKAEIHLTATSESLSAATWTPWQSFDANGSAELYDVGDIINATNGRATIRRDGTFIAFVQPRSQTGTGTDSRLRARIRQDPDGSPVNLIVATWATGANDADGSPYSLPIVVNADDVLECDMWRTSSGTLFGNATDLGTNTKYALIEQL